jgi:Tol biopolymer transport system component
MSRDGTEIAFDDWGSAAGASGLAYVRKTDGSAAIKLGLWGQPVLSYDGAQVLAFDATTIGQHLEVLPTGVGEVRALNAYGMQQISSPGFMPDGQSIYFAGDEGKGWRMYVQSLAGGAPRAVSPLTFIKPSHFESQLVSPDGKFIFARDLSEKGVLFPISGGEARTIPGWLPEDIWITWSADGRSAYVYHDEKTSAPVYRLDVANGKRERIATLTPSDPAGVTAILNVRMTPDGKTYAYSFFRELSDMFLVEGVR